MAQPEEELIDFYANAVRFAIGVYDFALEFAVQEPQVDPSKPVGFQPKIRVRMSPQHALVVARALSDAVEKYQRQIGKIEVPGQIFRQMGIEP